MTKRQRAIEEEETHIFAPLPKEAEHIERAKQRIRELHLLIIHWRQQQ